MSVINVSALPGDGGGSSCQIKIGLGNTAPAGVTFKFYKNGVLIGSGTSVAICSNDGTFTFSAKGDAPDGSGYWSGQKSVTIQYGYPNDITIPLSFNSIARYGYLNVDTVPTGKTVSVSSISVDSGNPTPNPVMKVAPFKIRVPTGTYKIVDKDNVYSATAEVTKDTTTDIILHCTCLPCGGGSSQIAVSQYLGLGSGDVIRADGLQEQFLIKSDGKKHWIKNITTRIKLIQNGTITNTHVNVLSLKEVNKWPTGSTINYATDDPRPDKPLGHKLDGTIVGDVYSGGISKAAMIGMGLPLLAGIGLTGAFFLKERMGKGG